MKIYDGESIPEVVHLNGIEAFGMEPEEAFVFSRVDGTTSFKGIAQILAYDVERVSKLLSRYINAGYLKVNDPIRKRKPPEKRASQSSSILHKLDEDEKIPELAAIPRSIRNDIWLRYEAGATQNHYEILEAESKASEITIKKNYFRLVKECHPDRLFEHKAGHYREKLGVIFGRISEAFEVLSDPMRRKAYDRSLGSSKSADESSTEKEPKKRRAGNTLIERLAEAKKHFARGLQEEAAGNPLSAASFVQMAVQFDGKNKEYLKAWERLRPVVMRKKSEGVYTRGIDAITMGNVGEGIGLLEEALVLNPRKKECYRDLAVLYLRSKRSLERAKELGLRAVEFFAEDSDVHSMMGEIFQELGMEKEARKEFKLALKLDKDNESAREGLERIAGK